MRPGGGSGGLWSLLMSGNWPFVLPLVARIWDAAFQPACLHRQLLLAAASITAEVVAVAANAADAFSAAAASAPSGAPPPP